MPGQVHSEYELLLLGLLRRQAMHGYQLMETIQTAAITCINLKKPTVYFFLKRMEKSGWVSSRSEKEGHHPPKMVYQITPQGEIAFQKMLRENLHTTFPLQHDGDIGLIFSDDLPDEDVAIAIRSRIHHLESEIARIRQAPAHPARIQWMLDHQLVTLQHEIDWHQTILAKLQTHPE
jgi:DNA-binding PadR family transcriptional regulator